MRCVLRKKCSNHKRGMAAPVSALPGCAGISLALPSCLLRRLLLQAAPLVQQVVHAEVQASQLVLIRRNLCRTGTAGSC